MSGCRVRRIMAIGIDAPTLEKGAISQILKQAQKVRVDDGPTAFTRRNRKVKK